MKKSFKISFDDGSNSIHISNFIGENDTPLIEVNVGEWMGNNGGSDGESIIFTPDEFEEFITDCTKLLDFIRNGEVS